MVGDAREILLARRAEDINDQPELMQIVAPGEERLPPEHFREDATDRPHVDRGGVALVLDEELRCAVPARHDVLGEAEVLLLLGGVDRAREAEVADLQVAVLVHQQVARLQVTVEHMRSVDSVHAAEDLVEEVLEVLVGEGAAWSE